LTKTLDTSLILAGSAKPKKPKRKQQVMDEDAYVKTLDTIIGRDYFPALQPLENLLSGQRSVRRSVRLSVRSAINGSFEDDTPDIRRPASPEPGRDRKPETESEKDSRPVASITKPESLSLDQFTHNFTSEDNESFEQLIEVEEKRREEKVFWLEENAKQAAKHIISRIEEPKRTGMLDSWTYTVRNSLMFYPSGDEVTQASPPPEVPQKAVVPENTRFPGGFFDKPSKAVEKKLEEAVPGTPMIGGHKLLRTPTPSLPAGQEIVTWGDIIGTPLHLKNEDLEDDVKIPANSREFRVPPTPSRDEILFKLDAQAKERSKRMTGSARRTTTPSRTPRTPMMSPSMRGRGDPQLRASYSTPTPSPRGDSQLRASYTPTPIPRSSEGFARPLPRRPRATPALTPTPSPAR